MIRIPPRSLLISPRPLGLGHAAAESLLSYISRVTTANGLAGGQLLFGSWAERLGEDSPALATLREQADHALRRRTMSCSRYGHAVADNLAELVGRPSVTRMSLWSCFNECSLARLIRAGDAYCPICLKVDPVPYLRIAWEMRLVSVCWEHECVLVTVCPACGTRRSRQKVATPLWQCPVCGHDRRADAVRPADADEIAAALQIGRLISLATSRQAARLSTNLSLSRSHSLDFAAKKGAGSVKRSAKFLGLSVSTVSLWRRHRGRISVARVCECAIRVRLGVDAIFTGRPLMTDTTTAPITTKVWKKNTISSPGRQHARERLAKHAQDNPFRPAADVASDLHVCSRTLRSLEPALYSQIKANYAEHRRRVQNAKLAWFCAKVDLYVSSCLDRRELPTWRGLGQTFNKPGILRDPLRRKLAKVALRRAAELLPDIPQQLELDLRGSFMAGADGKSSDSPFSTISPLNIGALPSA